MSARPDALIEEAIETVNLSLGVNAPCPGDQLSDTYMLSFGRRLGCCMQYTLRKSWELKGPQNETTP